jgi:hypothetical protein
MRDGSKVREFERIFSLLITVWNSTIHRKVDMSIVVRLARMWRHEEIEKPTDPYTNICSCGDWL